MAWQLICFFFIHSCCTQCKNIKVDYFGQTCVQVNKYFYIFRKVLSMTMNFFFSCNFLSNICSIPHRNEMETCRVTIPGISHCMIIIKRTFHAVTLTSRCVEVLRYADGYNDSHWKVRWVTFEKDTTKHINLCIIIIITMTNEKLIMRQNGYWKWHEPCQPQSMNVHLFHFTRS